MKFRKPRTEEQLKKISEVRTGMPHKQHKKHVWKEGHSEETKKRISEALRGHKTSEKTREKLSAARRGKALSQETKKRISESHKGRLTKQKNLLPGSNDAQSLLTPAIALLAIVF